MGPELRSMDLESCISYLSEIQEINIYGDFLLVGSKSFKAKNHATGRGRGPATGLYLPAVGSLYKDAREST